MIDNKDAALNYLQRGFSIIPLYSPSMLKRSPPQKWVAALQKALEINKTLEHPLPKNVIIEKRVITQCKRSFVPWTQFQKRLPTEAEVSQWFTQNPDANIGIVTGKLSNLCVFDIDSKEAQEYADELGGFPDTPKAKTGKGWHYYMSYPDFEVRPSVNKELEIDIRAEGSYIAAPPSIHGSGVAYEWEDGCSFAEIDPAPCSSALWVIDYLKAIAKKEKPAQKKDNAVATNTTQAENKFVELLKNGCSEGSRNSSTLKLVGHLFGKNLAAEMVWEMIKDWNTSKNTPPLDMSEIKEIFNSVKKYESHKSTKTTAKKKEKDISIASLLETREQAIAEYDESYVQISFAGSNLKILEKKMNGGLIGGRFYVIGGIPTAGKTLFVNNMADNVCLNGHPVLFFSFDDGKSEIRYRTWSRFSKISIEKFNRQELEKPALKKIVNQNQIKKIMGLKYVVQENISIDKWEKLINQFIVKYKKAPLIIIDYLRQLKTDKDSSDERLRVDNILNLLTDMAKKYNTPIVAISELARDSYKTGQRLSMASFKESGTIEYQASWLGILSCVEEINGEYKLKNNWKRIIEQDGHTDLIVFKAKRGTGTTGKIPLSMNKDTMVVKDREDKPRLDTITAFKKKSSLFD
jgi:replicative DNA helicase